MHGNIKITETTQCTAHNYTSCTGAYSCAQGR